MDIVFDINGCELSTSSQSFVVYGTMNLLDSTGTGKMLAGTIMGGCVSDEYGGILNLYSGTRTSAEGSVQLSRGGILYSSDGVINMYGGTVINGFAKEGGNVYLRTDVSLCTPVEGGASTPRLCRSERSEVEKAIGRISPWLPFLLLNNNEAYLFAQNCKYWKQRIRNYRQ